VKRRSTHQSRPIVSLSVRHPSPVRAAFPRARIGYRAGVPPVHTTRVEIDAPAGLVWAILAGLPAYSDWNPSTPHITTDGVPGRWIDLLVCLDDGALIRELVVLRRWTPGEQLRWDRQTGPAWWFRCEHVQQVESLGPGRCCYVVTDTYAGLLAPLFELRDGARFERAAERTAAALKRRAEAFFQGSSPDEDEEHEPLSPAIRDTFLLRGRFVAPPPRPARDEPPDELAQLLAGLGGYDRTITFYQSPSSRLAVSRASWQPCHECGQRIPVDEHWQQGGPGEKNFISAISYVCPHCHATQLGAELRCDPYKNCHVCDAPLGDSHACPRCGMLRYWIVVDCPHCPAKQAVCAPHLGVRCDMYTLECVACGTEFCSLCIC